MYSKWLKNYLCNLQLFHSVGSGYCKQQLLVSLKKCLCEKGASKKVFNCPLFLLFVLLTRSTNTLCRALTRFLLGSTQFKPSTENSKKWRVPRQTEIKQIELQKKKAEKVERHQQLSERASLNSTVPNVAQLGNLVLIYSFLCLLKLLRTFLIHSFGFI